ncbi:MAG TPA: hypothetical protein VE996_07765 [Terriglobales bacterium]|nr:hypothetical protein [Terriglobales bacterium]
MDLRTPIGWLFTVVGVLLTAFGWLHRTAAFMPTGIDIDLVWGVVLLVFGLFMLGLAWRARKRRERGPAPAAANAAAASHERQAASR